MASEEVVRYKCIKVGSRLRVRVTSPGYNHNANCQFPRDIREDGREYTTSVSALKFSQTRGKFFYKVTRKIDVTVIVETTLPQKIYEKAEDCVVCFDHSPQTIFYECGHFVCCAKCSEAIFTTTKKCPMCRANIKRLVMEIELE